MAPICGMGGNLQASLAGSSGNFLAGVRSIRVTMKRERAPKEINLQASHRKHLGRKAELKEITPEIASFGIPSPGMMIGTFHPKTLVMVSAAGSKRPDWRDAEPRPARVLSSNGNVKVEGNCEGKNRYSAGSFCSLEWSPSPTEIILARADYVVWWQTLVHLAETVELAKFKLLPPAAAAEPWFGEVDNVGEVIPVPPTGPLLHLPLTPERGRMLAPFRRAASGPVYHLMENGKFREGAQ
jgi:hypothetical protein